MSLNLVPRPRPIIARLSESACMMKLLELVPSFRIGIISLHQSNNLCSISHRIKYHIVSMKLEWVSKIPILCPVWLRNHKEITLQLSTLWMWNWPSITIKSPNRKKKWSLVQSPIICIWTVLTILSINFKLKSNLSIIPTLCWPLGSNGISIWLFSWSSVLQKLILGTLYDIQALFPISKT